MRRFSLILPLLLPLMLAGCTEDEAKDSGAGSDGAASDGGADGGADGAGDGAGDGGDTGCEELPFYVDADGDGYGVGEPVLACEAPEGHAPTDGDCDDGDAAFNPGAAEDDRLMVVSGVSKSHAMTGFRTGWLRGSRELVAVVTKLQEPFISCCVPFAQVCTRVAIIVVTDAPLRRCWHPIADVA